MAVDAKGAQAAGSKPVFDDYEISPCRRFEEPDAPGRFYFEVCEPAEADVWTLYGHINGQGVEAIGDFGSREAAAEVYQRITGQPFTGSYEAGERLRLMHAAPKLRDALWAALPYVEAQADRAYACAWGDDNGERGEAIDRQHARMLEAYAEATGHQKEEVVTAIGIERLMQADVFIPNELDERIVRPEFHVHRAQRV